MKPNDDLRRALVDLAAIYRAAYVLGLDAGTDNHFTLMVPGSDRQFLFHACGLHFSEVTASTLIVYDPHPEWIELQFAAMKRVLERDSRGFDG